MLTQYERSEVKFERKDEKIASLIRSLEEETRNVVPWRHYAGMLNLVKELQRIMVRALHVIPKNKHAEINEMTTALDIVEMHFREGGIGEVSFIDKNRYQITVPKPKKRRGRPPKDKQKK
mgnify:FL=1